MYAPDEEQRWALALIPFDDRHCTEDNPVINYGRPVPITNHDTAAKRRRFYEALLDIAWLPSIVRSAIMTELGRSLQTQKHKVEEAVTLTLEAIIDEQEALLRKQGQRLRGGVRAAAIDAVADGQGITVEALKKRLQRGRKKRRSP
jgi:hypothetical protein